MEGLSMALSLQCKHSILGHEWAGSGILLLCIAQHFATLLIRNSQLGQWRGKELITAASQVAGS